MFSKTSSTLFIVMLCFIATSMGSCRSGKKAVRNELGKELQMPCDERKHKTDDEFIRATQIGRSSDLSLSKEKAFLMTQERVASLIESSLRAAARRYANERGISTDYDFAERTESMILSSVNHTSNMMSMVCEKTFINEGGVYSTAMTLEISKEGVLSDLFNRQNRERHFRLDEDMRDFEKLFNEETLKENRR